MAETQSQLTVNESNGVFIVNFSEHKILQDPLVTEIFDELLQFVDGQKGIKLVLSFSEVELLASATLGKMITLNNKILELNGQLRLSDISQTIYQAFKITKLNKLFIFHDTEEQALASL